METARSRARPRGRKSERPLDFQEVHRLYRPKIFRYLARLVGGSEAEDLTQEVFLKVSRGLQNFGGRSQVSTWIYRIATNTALDEMRKPSFKGSATPLTAENPFWVQEPDIEKKESGGRAKAESPAAELSLIRQEMFDCLRTYIDKLAPNYRAALILSVLEGMKHKEIAEILGVNIETVKIRLHRGRSKLVKELETHCGWYRDRRNRLTWDGKIL